MTQLSRRSLITGLVSFAVTAPALVRAASLMPVKVTKPVRCSLRYCSEAAAFDFSGFYTLYPVDAAIYDQLRGGVIVGYDIMQDARA